MTTPTEPGDFVRVKNGGVHVYGGYFWHTLSGSLVDAKFVKAAILAACEVAVEAYIEKLQAPYPSVKLPATLDAIDKTLELFGDEKDDYEMRVIAHLKSGKATEEDWAAVAAAMNEVTMLDASPSLEVHEEVRNFDCRLLGPFVSCQDCGAKHHETVGCWGCDESEKA